MLTLFNASRNFIDDIKSVEQWPALQASEPEARAKATVARYQAAKQAASDAKARGNKESQAAAGRLIRELKSELGSLGLLSLLKGNAVAEGVLHCFYYYHNTGSHAWELDGSNSA